MLNSVLYSVVPVESRLDLKDPFIFTVHHQDHYPQGNTDLGPVTPPYQHEYDMYYGEQIPGFPEHPHTGFETITIVERGYVDHFDSLENSGRYAAGDVQWLTTGNGVQHCEMFPLVHQDQDNPLELFQIWLNSSPEQKKQPADYKMLWREQIPHVFSANAAGPKADIRVISGQFKDTKALDRPPHSWAAPAENRVNIYMITLAPEAELIIPASTASATRFCYFYQGKGLELEGQKIQVRHLVELKPDQDIHLKGGLLESHILWLEGEPIGAPVAMRGPFVLNTQQELDAAFRRYRDTQFGTWPWPNTEPSFPREQPRFASYDGGQREEYPEQRSH
ncbi:pirin family protein [Acinetobacter pseudolwoffii]|uniref:Pirin family protein n=1 Tax=Acinetobacter pseudolwoffii TaxID=2053287 RepID=A0A2H9UJ04_9GAMM|nr:pirin family protein [Acinetobacter pseudolwoffii]PJI31658.1 pirin family protein [Acinetobacter pseudolwoffii]